MSKLNIYSILAGAVVLSYTAWAAPISIWSNKGGHVTTDQETSKLMNCTIAEIGQACTPEEGPLMLGEYLACSSQAETRTLSLSRAIACMEAYLTVKLSFISGVEPNSYRQMPREQRLEINRRAFEAYRNWMDRNPTAVAPSV